MDLTWKQIFGRSIVAIVALLLSIYVVKCTHGCKGNFYNVNYVLVAYMFVITLVVLQLADSYSGLGIQDKLTKKGYMENYRRDTRYQSGSGAEYYTGVHFA
jgi:hypothetical protein